MQGTQVQHMGAGGFEASRSSWEAGRELPAPTVAVNSLLATLLFRLLGGDSMHSSPNKQRRAAAAVTSGWKHAACSQGPAQQPEGPTAPTQSEQEQLLQEQVFEGTK